MATTFINGVSVEYRPPAKIVYCPKPSSKATHSWLSFPRFVLAIKKLNNAIRPSGLSVIYGTKDKGRTIRLLVSAPGLNGELSFFGHINVSDSELLYNADSGASPFKRNIIRLLDSKVAGLPYTSKEMLVHAINCDKKGWELEANIGEGKTRRYTTHSIIKVNVVGDAIPVPSTNTVTVGGLQTYHTAIDTLHRSGKREKNANGNNPNPGGKKGRGLSRIQFDPTKWTFEADRPMPVLPAD